MPPKPRSVNNLKRSTLKGDRRRGCDEAYQVGDRSVCDVDSHLPLPALSFNHAAIIVSLAAFICFWNSCDGDFVFDDSEAVLGNKDVNPETPLLDLFIHDFWGSKLASNESHKSYRPLTILTFRWNCWLAGGLKPWGFHFVNVVLHALNCVLLLPVFSVVFSGVQMINKGWKRVAPKSSFLCTLLFAVHPIHSESVAAVVGRADLSCTLCVIISFLLYVRCCHPSHDSKGSQSEFSWLMLLSSFVFCGLALLFKEQGITVLGVCCVYDVVVACRIDLLKLCRSYFPRNKEIQTVDNNASAQLQGFLYRLTGLSVCGVLFLIGRWQVMGSALPSFKAIDNPASFEKSFLVRVVNFNYIYSLNCWIMVNPWWLCFDWSMGCVPLIKTATDPRILAPFAMWLVLFGLIWRCLTGANTQFRRTCIMGIALLVIPFLPATNVFFRVGFVIAERVLYLPSAGFCVLVVLGLTTATEHFPNIKKILVFAFGVLLLLFLVRSVKRSAEWTSDEALYLSGEDVCPLNAKVHYNIGKIFAEQKNQGEEALRYYRRAVSLNPNYDQALNNLGNLLKARGEVLEAEKMLERAIEVSEHSFPAGWMNLGTVKAALNKPQEAERCYLNAIKFRRKYPDAYFNLGNLYIDWNQKTKAITAFQAAISIDRHHLGSWTNYMLLLEKTGEREKAVEVGYQALKHLPNEAGIHFNLGNMLGQLDRFKEGENHFLKSLKLKPDHGELHGNLGVLYHRWGKLEKAELYYRKALELDPHSQNVNENLKKLSRLKSKKAKASHRRK